MKKRGKKLVSAILIALISVVMFGTGVAYAATALLNWTGNDAMTNAGIYIEQSANKIINMDNQQKTLAKEKAELEKQIEKLKQELDSIKGWNEKDQQIVDLKNEIISKQNEVDHLTQQLQAANSAASEIQKKLDKAYQKLENAGISIWN